MSYFEISTDGGLTYNSASNISIDYAYTAKWDNYSDTNPLQILFRKNSLSDSADYRVVKILVNEASTFASPLGDNTTGQGTQLKQGNYLAGRYATYDKAESGGLNFSDFKIAGIKAGVTNTEMQMVFFVTAMNGLDITIKNYQTPTVYNGSAWAYLVIYLSKSASQEGKTSIGVTLKEGEKISFYTYAEIHTNNGTDDPSYSLNYGIGKNDVYKTTELNKEPNTKGFINWSFTVESDKIVWEADPVMQVTPISFSVTVKLTTDDFEVTVPKSGYYVRYTYNSDGSFSYPTKAPYYVDAGTYAAIEKTYDNTKYWCVKNDYGNHAGLAMWGFQDDPNSISSSQHSESKKVSWSSS